MTSDAGSARPDLAALPSVDRLLRRSGGLALVAEYGHSIVSAQARALLMEAREAVRAGEAVPADAELDAAMALRCAQRGSPRLKAVLNLTGTVIHTNLGRAVLARQAIAHVAAAMAAPVNLEYDLEHGTRGNRDAIIEDLLCELTGAEAATVVNNNAAAVLLTVAALAHGRELILSRGELVEIGGAFRMPEVMASAGGVLVEVGTTNRTHLRDYERAITPNTAVLMKVHASNYAMEGYTSSVGEAELASVARRHGLKLVTDLGSGSLIDMRRWGLPKEPTPQEMLSGGCDIVTFSGDKLLGGPQAGLIVGKKACIDLIRNHPIKRALRVGKPTIAALEGTLRLYLRPDTLAKELPTLRLLTRSPAEIADCARSIVAPLSAAAPGFRTNVVEMRSQIGSGSLPVDRLPSWGIAMEPIARRGVGGALNGLAQALRKLPLPVIGRIEDDRLLMDCRCLEDTAPFLEQLPLLSRFLAASPGEPPGT